VLCLSGSTDGAGGRVCAHAARSVLSELSWNGSKERTAVLQGPRTPEGCLSAQLLHLQFNGKSIARLQFGLAGLADIKPGSGSR
jgi:hypothetical protein